MTNLFKNKYEARAHITVSLINNKLDEKEIINDMEKAAESCHDLYLPDDDLPIQDDKSMWSLDYFYKQIGLVKMTFSKERLIHILEVRKYLRSSGEHALQHVSNASKLYNKPKLKQEPKSRRISDSSTRKLVRS